MWIWVAGAVALVLLVLFVAYVVVRYVPIIERNGFEVPRHRAPEVVEVASQYDTRDIRMDLPDGGQLAVRRIVSSRDPRGVVVFCHETGAGALSWAKHASFLPEAGYDVMTFDYERGPETCQWPAASELQKVEAVLAWLWREEKERPVFVFGVSKGSVLAAGALWHPAVKAAVLDGVFSTYSTMEQYMKKWVTIYVTPEALARAVPYVIYKLLSRCTLPYASRKKKDRFFSIESFASRFHKPALFVHASKDHVASLADVESVRKLFRAPTTMWIAEGAGHSESACKQPQAYRSEILSFLQTHLAS